MYIFRGPYNLEKNILSLSPSLGAIICGCMLWIYSGLVLHAEGEGLLGSMLYGGLAGFIALPIVVALFFHGRVILTNLLCIYIGAGLSCVTVLFIGLKICEIPAVFLKHKENKVLLITMLVMIFISFIVARISANIGRKQEKDSS
ncbi:MAG: hypothetical protein PHV60_06605 [bacterium]|nr:hypothetical protein [bacterium]